MLYYSFWLHSISVYWINNQEHLVYDGIPIPALMEFELGWHDGDMESLEELNSMLEHNNQLWRQRRRDWILSN